MRAKDWIAIIVMSAGLLVSAATFAFKTFETQDANRGQHDLMLRQLERIENKIDRISLKRGR